MLAWGLWLVTFGCCAAGLVVTLALIRPLTFGVLADGASYALAFPLGYATVGLVLSLRRPANPIGWLYAASALTWSLIIPLGPWVDLLFRDHRPLPLVAQLNAMASELVWAPAIAFGITLPALLLPDGRLRSRRWRPVAVAAVAGSTMFLGAGLLAGTTTVTSVPVGNPLGLAGVPLAVATAIAYTGLGLYFASLPAALVCLVLRFRSSVGTERQQLRWVVAGAAAAVALLLLPLPDDWIPVMTGVAVLCVPVSVAVAVLRYRLWDLDRLVSRTVTYAVVTALLVVPYLLIVPAAARLAQGSGSLAVAAATLAAVALFQPLRRRVQDLVDRRFNRRRYDAARTVDGFAARLRDQVDLDAAARRAAGRGRPHHAADPGLALAPPAGRVAGAPASGTARRLMQPERRPLVVAAELEAPPPGDRRLVALDVHVLDRAAELAHPLQRRPHVVDPEEQVRRGPLVPPVHPPGHVPRPDRPPLARRPPLEPPPEQALVEHPPALHVLDTQLEERHLTGHPASSPRQRTRQRYRPDPTAVADAPRGRRRTPVPGGWRDVRASSGSRPTPPGTSSGSGTAAGPLAGELGRRFRRSHGALGVADLLIAASAERLRVPCDPNVRHFPMFEGLEPAYRR